MRLGKIYRNYIQNNLFVKVILVFALIVVATIITLSYLLFNFMSAQVRQNELKEQKELMDRVNRYLEQKYAGVEADVQEIYRNGVLANNVSYLLKHSYQEYIQYTLNESSVGNAGAANALDFFGSIFDSDPDVRNVIVYSSEVQQLYVYSSPVTPKLYRTDLTHSYIPDMMSLEGPNANIPNIWIRKTINQWDTRLYSMRARINDKNTLKNIGQLLVYFDSELIRKALPQNSAGTKGQILVLTPDGQVMFDTSGLYYGQKYPYFNRISSLKEEGTLEEPSYISTLSQSDAGYTIVGVMPKKELTKATAALRRTIVLISLICIAVAIVIPSLVVISIARRTNKIVRFMRKVEGGDLGARLHDDRDDELGQISSSFNDMVEELGRMIDREYKAEIRLKRTELAALQARINPHFLYNTLEVIRMRAMSRGADDVAEMIYSLATLFRNSVRTNAECSLAEELEMCRLYLELFRIRYKDRFSYTIDCDPRLASLSVPKMLLQPLVENYIVHGMEPRRTDNRIEIGASLADGLVAIRVRNNGRPIETERLEQIRADLNNPEEEGDSFGLRSVHSRLKLIYGPEYGVELLSADDGTEVTMRFPLEAGEKGADKGDV
ncbi:sensor histidine kinase [Cohnella zeiphila]|uniref:Sensor histidine kinase n=1 Tax=Cohnella zeiphila TaxID=2761120 RepID=A0A7X0VU26_9BACL|nr:sensor histidine kinase [Cohnella zeiphila]MBB6730566.1 sensor histidine kinase [Cohnella zeiphila]